MSDKQGAKYLEQIEAMEVGHEAYEEELRKYDSPAYQRAAKLKNTSIVELEKRLRVGLESKQYVKLSFEKPEEGRYFTVPFSVQDANVSRKKNVSILDLQKILKELLEDTNWRLMSNGISYRLGYLSGRLRGYEHEEDLLELSGEESKEKPSKIDPEKRAKYAHHSWVNLARLSGRMQGIENVRKERLKKEPDGFPLEASEGPYDCGICHESTPGDNIWWTVDGIKCVDCRRNIQEGVIPDLTKRDDDSWIQGWQIKSHYSVHPSTRRMLERKGILKSRELKKADGSVYCTVYLKEDNAKFLKKYPKKPEMKMRFKWTGDEE